MYACMHMSWIILCMHIRTRARLMCATHVMRTRARTHTHKHTNAWIFAAMVFLYPCSINDEGIESIFAAMVIHARARTHTHLCLRLSFSLSHSLTLSQTHTRDYSKQRSHATRFSHANPGVRVSECSRTLHKHK